jgi:hypothetical protein
MTNNGEIHFWHSKSDRPPIPHLALKTTIVTKSKYISMSPLGNFAIGSQFLTLVHESASQLKIEIWERLTMGFYMTVDTVTTRFLVFNVFSGAFVDISWYVTTNGFEILALGLSKHIEIYIKKRKKDSISKWSLHTTFKLTETLITLGWLWDFKLLVSTSSNYIIKPIENLLETVNENSGRMSDIHPILLYHYLISGKYEQVSKQLSILNLFVKLAVESGSGIVDTPAMMWDFFEVTDSQISNVDDLFGEDTEIESKTLGQFTKEKVDFLMENIPKLKLRHMLDSDRDQLVIFIKAFSDLDQYRYSLDVNATRYLLPALMVLNNGTTGMNKITSRDSCWAFFSDSQDFLLEMLLKNMNGKMVWEHAKSIGLGWWIRNPETLVNVIIIFRKNMSR